MARSTQRRPVTRIRPGRDAVVRADTLAAEEPLEIRVGGRELAVTMRTPGGDFDLAAGFLLSEGVVSRADDVAAITYRGGELSDGSNTFNVVDVTLAPGVPPPDPEASRAFYTTSSCGICGKASISAVRTVSRHAVAGDDVVVDAAFISALPDRLREQQDLFATTGGLHAAALVDAASGDVLVVREDVGRHNAVDKVVGWALREGRVPLTGCVLQVSGRVGFELVQKASMAGVPVLSAVSAPSSLAADLAEEIGLTLVGFVRGGSMVVYTRPDRVRHEHDAGEPHGDSADGPDPSS